MSMALDHLKCALRDYCRRLGEKSSEDIEIIDESDSTTLPDPLQVADWAFVAFSGLVMFNGVDHPLSENSECYISESQLVSLLFDQTEQAKAIGPLAAATDERLKQVINPPAIYFASNLNILCLARLLSYLPQQRSENYLALSIYTSFRSCAATALASLPKLLACYCSIKLSKKPSNEYLSYLELAITERVDRNNVFANKNTPKSTKENPPAQLRAFTRLLFQNCNYLLRSKMKEITVPLC